MQKWERRNIWWWIWKWDFSSKCATWNLFTNKNIRELMLARAVATSVVAPKNEDESSNSESNQEFSEDEILKDWFDTNG